MATATKKARSPHQPTGTWITRERRLAIYIRDEFSCLYCGVHLKDALPRDVTLDHLTPRSEHGNNTSANLVTACRRCNSSRGNREWTDFAPGGAQDRILATISRPLNMALANAIILNKTNVEIEGAR